MIETAWNRLSAETLRSLAVQDALVLLPVASTEQHGPHLVTGVDDMLCTEVCKRIAALIARERPVVVAPTLWCGLADHHLAFGGTFSLSLGTYHAILRDLCRSVRDAGFKRVIVVNGHGGNVSGLATLAVELTRELAMQIATTTYFMEAVDEMRAVLEDQDGTMHACEAETSMMMAFAPDLVNHARLAEAHGPKFDLASSLMPGLKAPRSFMAITPSGVAGDARRATAAKGEMLLSACAGNIADRVLRGEPWC